MRHLFRAQHSAPELEIPTGNPEGTVMRAAFPHTHPWLIPLLLAVALSACGPKNLKERTRHGEKLSDEASSLLDDAEQSLRKLEPERAEEQLAEAKELVAHPDIELSPESEMLRAR